MIYAKIIGALSLLLALAGLGLWGQQQHLAAVKAKAEVETLTQQVSGLQEALRLSRLDGERKDAINLAKQRTINQLAAEAAKKQQALNEALKANRAWADAPVPDSVWDAIGPPAPGDKATPRSRVDGTRPDPGAGGQ